MAIFEGAGVALVQHHLRKMGSNYEKLEEIVEEQIAGVQDSIIVCGTQEKLPTMSHEEHLDVVGYVCKVTGNIHSVIAGTGSNCVRETAVYLSAERSAGADGLCWYPHHKATQNGLKAHFKAVARCCQRFQSSLYNIPGRTGVTILPRPLPTFAECGKHRGCKRSKRISLAIATLMNLADGKVDLYSGNDDQIKIFFFLWAARA